LEAKQSEETSISFCFEAKLKIEVKRSEMKNYLKRCKVKKSCFFIALVGSTKFEAKRRGKNSRERAKRIWFRFVSL
jgi:hypothetical protein